MPTNPYFDLFGQTNNDQRLYDELINESVYIHGVDCYYMPRDSMTKVDPIYGDDPTKIFKVAYPLEVFVLSVDEFEGGDIFSKFGIEVRKQVRLLVTRRSFEKNIPSTLGVRPREGDVLWLPNFRAFFEIKFATKEHFYYTFGESQIYGYAMTCEKWMYSQEQVVTGIDTIDDKVDELVVTYKYTMSNANSSGTYTIGERVFQANANGTVVSWNKPTLVLELKHTQGSFVINTPIVGANSNASYVLLSANTRDSINDNLDNNSDINTTANTILNFSESNPFGEPLKS